MHWEHKSANSNTQQTEKFVVSDVWFSYVIWISFGNNEFAHFRTIDTACWNRHLGKMWLGSFLPPILQVKNKHQVFISLKGSTGLIDRSIRDDMKWFSMKWLWLCCVESLIPARCYLTLSKRTSGSATLIITRTFLKVWLRVYKFPETLSWFHCAIVADKRK